MHVRIATVAALHSVHLACMLVNKQKVEGCSLVSGRDFESKKKERERQPLFSRLWVISVPKA